MDCNLDLKLKNGLRLYHVQDPTTKALRISLRGLAGASVENESQIGIAHFVEHMAFNGSTKYPTQAELQELITYIGGKSNASTGRESVKYWANGLSLYKEQIFEYLAELSVKAEYRQKDVNKEKKVIEQEIQGHLDSASGKQQDIINKALWPNQRAGIDVAGYIEHIESITLEKLEDFRNTYYTAQNFALQVTGDITKAEALDLAEKYFGHIPSGTTKIQIPIVTTNKDKQIIVENRQHLKQASISIVYPLAGYNDEYSHIDMVMNAILGQSPMCRLFQTLREKHNLAYSGGSSTGRYNSYGALYADAEVAEQNINVALDLMKKEFETLMNELAEDKELERVKNRIITLEAFEQESPSSIATFAASIYLQDLKIKSTEEFVQKVLAVTKEQVQESAIRIFSQNPKIVIMTPTWTQEQIEF
ncbi:MAG: pitrilysin family protein [Patescibacteria group bacterium]|uniref:Insulinase family protein n=1 Tax=candidate division WWE3 bacterium TaxID=2053526 RepID=A0A955J267_UNCKA|nr:insulinase family protein [candidate division WWE3 bacterium]